MSGVRRDSCLLAVVVLATLALSCAEETPPEPIRPVLSMVVQGPDQIGSRWFPGRAKAAMEVDLGFEVSGQLQERNIDVGDEVKAGQVMARLDASDYENLLARAMAESDRARVFFERVSEAAKTNAVSRQDVDDARARLDQAEAQLRIRRKAVADTRIVAPFDGLVAATFVDNFQNVRVKQPVIRLLDVTNLEMVVNIPENLINYSEYVTSVRLRFDAFPGVEIPGSIREIGREASQATRTFPVTLSFDPSQAGIEVQPGMAGEASATIEGTADIEVPGIEVPTSAIFTPVGEESQSSYVWIVEPSDGDLFAVRQRDVRPLRVTPRGGTLVEGLVPGERIVTAGVHRLREGMQVRAP